MITLEDKIKIIEIANENEVKVRFVKGEEIELVKFDGKISSNDFMKVGMILRKYWK